MRMRAFSMIFLGLLAAGGTGLSGEAPLYRWIDTQPSMAWAVSMRPESDGFTLVLDLPPPESTVGEGGVDIRPGGPSAWPEPGQPRLPVFPVLVELDEGLAYELAAEPGELIEVLVDPVRPVTRYQTRGSVDALYEVEEVTEPDAAIYATDAFWPDAWVETREAKGMGRRYLRIALMPYRYHPLHGVLRYAPDLAVRVRFLTPVTEAKP